MNRPNLADTVALFGAPVGLLVTSLLHPQPGWDATADLADQTTLWLTVHVVQLALIAGLAVTVRRLLDDRNDRPARLARAATVPFVGFYAGYDALVGLGTGLLAAQATGMTGASRQVVLEAGDAVFASPLGFALAIVSAVAWLVATIGAATSLRGVSTPAVPRLLAAAGVLLGVSHVGALGFGGAAALAAAAYLHQHTAGAGLADTTPGAVGNQEVTA